MCCHFVTKHARTMTKTLRQQLKKSSPTFMSAYNDGQCVCHLLLYAVAFTFLQHTNYNIWRDWTTGVMCTQETVITMNCTEYKYIYIYIYLYIYIYWYIYIYNIYIYISYHIISQLLKLLFYSCFQHVGLQNGITSKIHHGFMEMLYIKHRKFFK
jgi:hypothetical protein